MYLLLSKLSVTTVVGSISLGSTFAAITVAFVSTETGSVGGGGGGGGGGVCFGGGV